MKWMRIIKWIFAAIFLLLAGVQVQAALTMITVEQVRIVYPYVAVYYNDRTAENGEPFSVQAWLDDASLTVSEQDQDSYGTCYYVLLDISGSIPGQTFKAAKEQILEMTQELLEDDSLTLITFGDEVIVQYSGNDSIALGEVLDSISNSDMTTHIYQAIQETVVLSEAEAVGLSRQIIVVVSDGADISANSVSYEEALQQLTDSDIPLYAMCTSNASSAARTSFGTFARSTGGSILIFDQSNAQSQWDTLKESLEGGSRLLLTASTGGKVPTGSHTFLLKIIQEDVTEDYVQTVSVTTWVKDTEAPTVDSVTYMDEDNALIVKYSEEVSGAEKTGNYTLTGSDGSGIEILRIEQAGQNRYCLYLDSVPPQGETTLAISGITDVSMEENPLENSEIKFESPGVKEEEEQEQPQEDQETEEKEELPEPAQTENNIAVVVVAVVCVALVLLLFLIVLFFSLRKKGLDDDRHQEELQPQEMVIRHVVEHVEGGSVPRVESGSGSELFVSSLGKSGKVNNLVFCVHQTAILGRRADRCDICIDDMRVSGQHCVLEEKADGIYVTDLDSSNGVWLNDIRLAPRAVRKLNVNDRLRVGDTVFTINGIRLHGKGTADI